MKRIVSTLILVGIIITCVSCSKAPNSQEQAKTAEKAITTETSTSKEKLSKNCDYVLARGKDWDGSFYELVLLLTDEGNYQIGVIKNNKWIQKPSEKNPFLQLKDMSKFLDKCISNNDFSENFKFIGNGTFFFRLVLFGATKDHSSDGFFYNSNNNLYKYFEYILADDSITSYNFKFIYDDYDKTKSDIEHFENLICTKELTPIDQYGPHPSELHEELFLINTTSMKSKKINIKASFENVSPISEGLFAIYDEPNYKFYNCDGNPQFSTECNESYGTEVFFQAGKCAISEYINGKRTERFIDTKGNTVS